MRKSLTRIPPRGALAELGHTSITTLADAVFPIPRTVERIGLEFSQRIGASRQRPPLLLERTRSSRAHVVEDDSARGRYVIGDGFNPTVAELTEAAAVAAGAPGAVPGSEVEARARFGDYFAEVLLLDQGTFAAKARDQLGWAPTHPGLTDEFRRGSYSTQLTRG